MPEVPKARARRSKRPPGDQAKPPGRLAKRAEEIAALDLSILKDARSGLNALKGIGSLGGTELEALRSFSAVGADAIARNQAAVERATRPAEIREYRPFPSPEVRGLQAVEGQIKQVNEAIAELAGLIALQAEIAARQEAGIAKVVSELQNSGRAAFFLGTAGIVVAVAAIIIGQV